MFDIHNNHECSSESLYKLVLRIQKELLSSNYFRQGELFTQLGDWYNEKKEYLFASTVYNYVLNLYRIKNINISWQFIVINKIQVVEDNLLRQLEIATNNQYSFKVINTYHRNYLYELRKWCKQQLANIDKRYTLNIYNIQNIETQTIHQQLQLKKAECIHNLYKEIARKLKLFIQLLANECISILGTPPCEYTIISLGSLARDEATPYSDLEFAILIAQEQEDNKIYFRKFTKLLHFKIINLGETIIPGMAIPVLNNFCLDDIKYNWFYDCVTAQGISFDGNMPHACKHPLGKHDIDGNLVYELIHTPEIMVQLIYKTYDDLTDLCIFEKNGYLPIALMTASKIIGSDRLLKDYKENIAKALNPKKVKQLIKKLLYKNIQQFQDGLFVLKYKSQLCNVKKDLYRLPDRILECLAIYWKIQENSAWDRIEKMHQIKLINTLAAINLKIAVTIAHELRLRTYLAYNAQQNSIALTELAIKDGNLKNSIQHIYFIPDINLLLRFYCTIFPLYEISLKFALNKTDCSVFKKNIFFTKNYYVIIGKRLSTPFLQDEISILNCHKYNNPLTNNLFFLIKKVRKLDLTIKMIVNNDFNCFKLNFLNVGMLISLSLKGFTSRPDVRNIVSLSYFKLLNYNFNYLINRLITLFTYLIQCKEYISNASLNKYEIIQVLSEFYDVVINNKELELDNIRKNFIKTYKEDMVKDKEIQKYNNLILNKEKYNMANSFKITLLSKFSFWTKINSTIITAQAFSLDPEIKIFYKYKLLNR